MNASNDDNNNTITKINNQNISVASSSSPSLHANVIQVNADFNNDGFDDLAIGVPNEDVGSLDDAGNRQCHLWLRFWTVIYCKGRSVLEPEHTKCGRRCRSKRSLWLISLIW